jgi:hypothetical protein
MAAFLLSDRAIERLKNQRGVGASIFNRPIANRSIVLANQDHIRIGMAPHQSQLLSIERPVEIENAF